jgi:hypothetical protein
VHTKKILQEYYFVENYTVGPKIQIKYKRDLGPVASTNQFKEKTIESPTKPDDHESKIIHELHTL